MRFPRGHVAGIVPIRGLSAAALSVALGACAVTGTGRTAQAMVPGAMTALAPGDRARLPDAAHVHYLGLRSDSRCPPGVTCIHAGWAEIDVVHVAAGGRRTARVLSTRPGVAPVVADGWRLELVGLGRGPSPVAQLRASPTPH